MAKGAINLLTANPVGCLSVLIVLDFSVLFGIIDQPLLEACDSLAFYDISLVSLF